MTQSRSLRPRRTGCVMRLSRLIRRGVIRFAGDRRGVSAVEFALLLPLMLVLYLGTVEVSQGIAANRKVTLAARTVADLVSQVSSINNADMANSLNAAAAVMVPYANDNLSVRVSSIEIDAKGQARVMWSDARNMAPRAAKSTVTIPTAFAVPGQSTSLIWSEVSYNYTPTIGYVVTGTLTLRNQNFMRPRLSNEVARQSS